MKKLFVFALLLVAVPCFGADFTLQWDAASGATGYKVYVSNDGMVTWAAPIDVGNVLLRNFTGVAEDRVVYFKVSAYKGTVETVRHWSGAWYDHRLKPILAPGGAGIQ